MLEQPANHQKKKKLDISLSVDPNKFQMYQDLNVKIKL